MNYPPFEEALTQFYARVTTGDRPQRITVGMPELEKFTEWVERLPAGDGDIDLDDTAAPAAYDGIPINCAGAGSRPPAVE